jgi:hypothetical protein
MCFEKPFDIALATRKGTVWEKSVYSALQPYNFDVLFSRSPQFWKAALKMMRKTPPNLQDNGAEQLVMNLLVASQLFNVEILPCGYNFTPKFMDEDVEHASVLHLKGGRKGWIPAFVGALERGESRASLAA